PELVEAIHAGVILPTSELDAQLLIQDYKFLHDRVQQAAYALIDENQKQIIHLQIGRNLLQKTTDKTLADNLFEIVDHLNIGVEIVSDEQERSQIAKLNLMAARKAKAAAAYAVALKYLTTGIQLLKSDSWQRDYDLSLTLHLEAAEAAYLCRDFNGMERWSLVVLKEAKTSLEQVKAYEVRIATCVLQTKLVEAVKIGLQALELMGVNLPELPTALDVQQKLEEAKTALSGRSIEELTNLRTMTEADKSATMRILSNMICPAYQAVPTLLPLIVCEQLNLSIKHGNSPFSAFAYANYGMILKGVANDIERADQFSQLAISLVEKFNIRDIKCKILLIVALCIIHGKNHLRDTITVLQEAYSSGIENGDFEYASYAAMIKCLNLYFSGLDLTELEQEMDLWCHAIAQLEQENNLGQNQMHRQVVLNLLGEVENPCRLLGVVYNEEESLPFYLAVNGRTALHYLYLHKLILCYLFEEFTEAVENANFAEQNLEGATGMITVPIFHFYDSLPRLATYSSVSNSEQEYLLFKVTTNQEKMQKWAEYAPMNFQHKYDLVQAEKARVLGNIVEAEEFYERAIAGANKNEYIQEEALAYELAAKFYQSRGLSKFASTYMKEAHYCYGRWGAKSKVRDLEAKYPHLLATSSQN
ncbi:MAG: serine/threonine-protein kinase PknK, partial [Fischerella sp. CENA71]|nr:serine/threonine-protein kinase PknK [Fischerella sp. CENA71]